MGTTIPPTPRPNHAEERNLLPLDLWNRNVSSEAAPPRTVLSSLELHVHGLVCSRPLPRTIAKGPQTINAEGDLENSVPPSSGGI